LPNLAEGHAEALGVCLQAVRQAGAVPVSTRVLDSVMHATFACASQRSELHGRT